MSGAATGADEIDALATLVADVAACAAACGEPTPPGFADGRTRAEATIVVAGETKQGKSSLVNALVGVPDVCPISTEVATAVPIVVRHGPELTARVSLIGDDVVEIDPRSLSEWVSVATTSADRIRQVRGAEVTVPSALLASGVVLVDTPGVGGLREGNATLTLRTLQTATALLFVSDADGKLTASELDFLARAGEAMASIAFVVTKRDQSPHWREIVDENRETLGAHSRGLADAPMLVVSTVLAGRAQAIEQSDPERAARLWAESGMGSLLEFIADRVTPVAAELQHANTSAAAIGILDAVRASVDRHHLAATAAVAMTPVLAAEEERLAALQRDEQSWHGVLDDLLAEAQRALHEQVDSSAAEVRVEVDEVASTREGGRPAHLEARVNACLDAQAGRIETLLVRSVCDSAAALLEELDIGAPLDLRLDGAGEVSARPFRTQIAFARNPVRLAVPGLAGSKAGQDLSRAALQVVAAAGATVGGGLLTAFALLPVFTTMVYGCSVEAHRVRGERRLEVAAWVQSELDRATAALHLSVEHNVGSVRSQIATAVEGTLAERRRQVEQALTASRAAQSVAAQDRAALDADHDSMLGRIATLRARAEDQLVSALAPASLMSAGVRDGAG